ncbi:hypothetical protein [Flexivirga meconopsidis]|uniref:hypothetical protein n=1 Tax=Flexivirga meconopsidis TaxID=2977121 RepID=UPI00223F2750|nr:hypothetical protein [Flexivirga meconopsidis]
MSDNTMTQPVPQPIPPQGEANTGVSSPTVIHGVALLVMSAAVVLWRLIDHPDWSSLGIWLAVGTGAAFLLLAGLAVGVSRWRRNQEFERKLAQTRTWD